MILQRIKIASFFTEQIDYYKLKTLVWNLWYDPTAYQNCIIFQKKPWYGTSGMILQRIKIASFFIECINYYK